MSQETILEISPEQQVWMLGELRRCRYGYLLSLHILLLIARGRTPNAVAAFLCCSRSSVYRAIEAWQDGKLQEQWWSAAPESDSESIALLTPLQRSLLNIMAGKVPP
jgi:hypothetical protein